MENLKKEALAKIVQAADVKALEEARVAILGKNGSLTAEMKSLGALSLEEKKEKGALLNVIKAEIEKALADRMDELERVEMNRRLAAEKVDVTLPVRPSKRGKIHPDSQIHEEVAAIFGQMGFAVAEGPDIETQYYNFTALNTPENHPARQMQDTFYLAGKEGEDQLVLRTQTSAVQIRTMLKQKPPIKIIAPGRTYRSDYDATHTPMFHQVEGLVIDKNITLANLKGCLMDFLKAFFEIDDVKIRLRPSYFPFTEPSFEVDIGCKRGKGELKIGAGDDWLEILGCGMVHPNVLRNCGIDPEEYQGFAFGIGIDRIAMLKYGIPDLRAFFDSDLRWLEHYGFNPLKRPSLTGGLS